MRRGMFESSINNRSRTRAAAPVLSSPLSSSTPHQTILLWPSQSQSCSSLQLLISTLCDYCLSLIHSLLQLRHINWHHIYQAQHSIHHVPGHPNYLRPNSFPSHQFRRNNRLFTHRLTPFYNRRFIRRNPLPVFLPPIAQRPNIRRGDRPACVCCAGRCVDSEGNSAEETCAGCSECACDLWNCGFRGSG
ncbi:hypothetical protein BDW67DRAFT_69128 [Aspergillus spinulosporus]